MATVTITVCDECHNPSRPVRRYEITCEGRTAVRDLCQEHGAYLEALFTQPTPAAAPTVTSTARTRTAPQPAPRTRATPPPATQKKRRRESTKIATLEEIERLKAARRQG